MSVLELIAQLAAIRCSHWLLSETTSVVDVSLGVKYAAAFNVFPRGIAAL